MIYPFNSLGYLGLGLGYVQVDSVYCRVAKNPVYSLYTALDGK